MTPRVVVVGLGPGDVGLITAETLDLIGSVPARFGRTRRHPAASALGDAVFFDDLYRDAAVIDDVYPTIVERLAEAAEQEGTVLYAVPGSPAVAEASVSLLAADERVAVEVRPALSFVDLAWVRLGVDPLDRGVSVVDGHRFVDDVAGRRGPFLVAQCDSTAVLSAIKLAYDEAPSAHPVVLRRLGLPDETVDEIEWEDLDRAVEADHLTSLYLPEGGRDVATSMVELSNLVIALRHGCPWDARQTHRSLQRYLVEETHELLEAIDHLDDPVPDSGADDAVDHLAEELGDVLFQVVFHSVLATEEGWFTLADVAAGVHDKLYARHPHVFGGESVDDVDDLSRRWEEAKATEKDRESVMDGIANGLPALLYAVKVARKARTVDVEVTAERSWSGFDPSTVDPGDDEAVGELLLALAAAFGDAGVDPEAALRRAAGRAEGRVRSAGF